jgi:hypothetical protein
MRSSMMLVRLADNVGMMKSSTSKNMKYHNYSDRSPSCLVIAPRVLFVRRRRSIRRGPLRIIT